MTATRRITMLAGLLTLGLVAPTQAAFPGKNGKLVYQTDLDVAVDFILPEVGDEVVVAEDAGDPNWSSDGSRIVFTVKQTDEAEDQIARVNADGTGFKLLTTAALLESGRASWSPDATKIVFDRYNQAGNRERIMVMNADGSGLKPLTSPGDDEYDYSPVWSPDGRTIAFVSETGSSTNIHVMNTDGSHRHGFASESAQESDPAWSPDSRFIAYVRDGDIVVKAVSGGPASTVAEAAIAPDWSPDGRFVIYDATRIQVAGPATLGVYKRLANGTGDETLISPAGGRNGSWQPRCNLKGTSGANTLTGTRRSELICGRGGKDTIDGKGGNDIIFAGDGNDHAKGGLGDDVVVGGTGNDTLLGSDGRDRLVGEKGDDTLNGGRDTDVCIQGPGSGSKAGCES